MKETLDKVVKAILESIRQKKDIVYTTGSGVGLNLNHPNVKKSILNTIKKHNIPKQNQDKDILLK